MSYLVPISTHVPMKLAALMAGRGLSIFDAVIQTKLHVQQLLDSQNSNVDRYVCVNEIKSVLPNIMLCVLPNILITN